MAAFVQPPGEMLNGLSSPYGSFKVFAPQRLKKAEEITAEIIACIQPNQTSENRRTAIYNYLRLLIANCFSCKVCTIGSVPFKTYLPDGDMKLTIFSDIQNLTDTWAYAVGEKLIKSKNNNVDAKFDAKDVEYIKSGSKVHIVKCVVDNIEVEISYNQLGDLGTLCFFEEVDHLISQNHLFKRSIILIKAWCYYEARHKLISTHALETLVIYIFNVYNDSFVGPLEVLYRFLELFSNFDWDNYCVSLQGPVPISSLPDVAAEPPRKDSEELLMSRVFLQSCISVYGVHPHCQENEMQPFSKHFNIIDPLCTSNNLGHSVNEGDFVRIRNAFADGANKLGTLLDSSEESFLLNLNLFFSNTRIRHCSSLGPNIKISRNRHDSPVVTKYVYTKETNFDPKDLIFGFKGRESNFTGRHGSGLRPDSPISEILKKDYSNKIEKNLKKNLGSNQPSQRDSESNNISINNNLLNDIQGRFPFARTRSSPELTDTYSYNHNNRKKNSPTRSGRSSNEDLPSVRSTGGGLNNNYHRDEEQDEQDLVNVMSSSSSFQGGFNGQFHIPMNFPVGYAHQRNFPANIPLIDPSFSNIQFPNGLVSQPLTHYFSNVGIRANSEESTSTVNENFEQSTDNEFFDSENGDLDRSSLAGLKYIPPSRATGSTKSQPKYSKRGVEILSSSESFSGKTKEDKRGKKIVPAESSSSVYNKSKTISDDDSEMTEIPLTRSTGVLPFTFYATGPPVPFVTMLPLYNVPPGSSTEEGLDNTAEIRQKFDSSEVADERMSDILHSDFLCHWKNLQYGRFCQNVQPQSAGAISHNNYPTALYHF